MYSQTMATTPVFDHMALTVPNLEEQVERLTRSFGMVAELRTEYFAVLVDPGTGIKLELSSSDDADVHVRHFGFRADDVDVTHEHLVAAGMSTAQAPQRNDFADMYASFLDEPGCVEVQLVKYDS